MTTSNDREATVRKSQSLIRISSVVFIIAALFYLAVGVMGFLSANAGDLGYSAPTEALLLLSGIALAMGLFYLIAGILGLRAARDCRKVAPYCAISVMLAVLVSAAQVLDDYSSVGEALRGDIVGILELVFCVLAVINAIAALSLMGYNRRCGEQVPQAAVTPAAPAPAVPETPAASMAAAPIELRISSKIGSILHDKMDVVDAQGNVAYRVHSKAVSMSDRTFIEDAAGNEVASIHAKMVSVHDTYYVDMADGVSFELSRELLHLADVVNIDALGWQLRGSNMLEFSFGIYDEAGSVVATCRRHLLDLHDTYEVSVNDVAHADEIVAIFVVMKHILEHRAESAAASRE